MDLLKNKEITSKTEFDEAIKAFSKARRERLRGDWMRSNFLEKDQIKDPLIKFLNTQWLGYYQTFGGKQNAPISSLKATVIIENWII